MRTRLSAGLFEYQMDSMLRPASMSRGTLMSQVGQCFSRLEASWGRGISSCPHLLWVMVRLS